MTDRNVIITLVNGDQRATERGHWQDDKELLLPFRRDVGPFTRIFVVPLGGVDVKEHRIHRYMRVGEVLQLVLEPVE